MGTLVNGIKEIFATAKTTGSNVMLCGNDGTPDGHMTMANLASVLGVNNIYDIGYVNSESVFNEFIAHHAISDNDGKFSCRSCYYSGFSYFVLENYVTDLQFRVDYYNGKLEERTYIAETSSFSDWKEFTLLSYLNSYPNLASLANALRGVVQEISTTEDLNSLGGGLYSTSSNQQAQTNAPFGTEAFSMVVIVFANDRTLQIAIRDTRVKYRIKWGGEWKQWYEVSIF